MQIEIKKEEIWTESMGHFHINFRTKSYEMCTSNLLEIKKKKICKIVKQFFDIWWTFFTHF